MAQGVPSRCLLSILWYEWNTWQVEVDVEVHVYVDVDMDRVIYLGKYRLNADDICVRDLRRQFQPNQFWELTDGKVKPQHLHADSPLRNWKRRLKRFASARKLKHITCWTLRGAAEDEVFLLRSCKFTKRWSVAKVLYVISGDVWITWRALCLWRWRWPFGPTQFMTKWNAVEPFGFGVGVVFCLRERFLVKFKVATVNARWWSKILLQPEQGTGTSSSLITP